MSGSNERFIRIDASSKEEWLTNREGGIGGSDAACVLGLNPWKSSDEFFNQLIGISKPRDISQNVSVLYGTGAEDPIRKLFALDHPELKVEHFENQLLQRVKFPWQRASLDGELTKLEDGTKGVLEIKTTMIRSERDFEKWDQKVPDNYFVQILHNLLVSGFEFAILRAHIRKAWEEGSEFRDYFFQSKDLIEDLMILEQAEIEFMVKVQKGERPNITLKI